MEHRIPSLRLLTRRTNLSIMLADGIWLAIGYVSTIEYLNEKTVWPVVLLVPITWIVPVSWLTLLWLTRLLVMWKTTPLKDVVRV